MIGLLNQPPLFLMMAIEQKFVLTVVSTRIGPIRQIGHGDMYRKGVGDAITTELCYS